MRIITIIIFIFGLASNIAGQDPFLRSYGGVGSDYGKAIIECSAGGYLIVGSTNSFYDSSTDIYVLRLTADGDYIWGRNIGFDNQIEWGHDVKEAADGGFYITGITNNTTLNDYAGMLVKIDANGNTLWTKTYGGPGWDFIENMAITESDEIILSGQKTVNDIREGWILKTDSEGEVLWEETIAGTGMVNITGIDVCDNGNIVFVGYNDYIPLDSQTQMNGVLTQGGELIWASAFPEFGTVVTKNCVCGMSNRILTMGTQYEDDFSVVFFTSINSDDGSVNWTQQYIEEHAGEGGAISEINDGEILISGSIPIGFGLDELDALLDKREPNGSYISDDFSDVFGGYGEDIVHDIIPTSNGGYTAVGQTTSFGNNSQIMLIHVGSNGEDIVENEDFLDIATSVDNKSSFNIKVWPNPASTLISIEIPSDLDQEMNYKIIDALGATHLSGILKKNGDAKIDIARLPEGIYFLKVSIDSKSEFYSQRFIKTY